MESLTTPYMSVNMALKQIVKLAPNMLEKFKKQVHGARRPTKYAEFISLEVLPGGFATGNVAAPLATDEDRALQDDLFRSSEGFGALQMLLETGNYTLEMPENGAMLVAAWLLEKGRHDDMQALVDSLSPYMSEVKFVPTVIAEAAPINENMVACGTVGMTRKQLSACGNPTPRVKVVSSIANLNLLDVRSEAVRIILTTAGNGAEATQGNRAGGRNCIPTTCARLFVKPLDEAGRRDAEACAGTIGTLLKAPNVSRRHQRPGSAVRVLQRTLSTLLDASWREQLSNSEPHVREIVAAVARHGAPGSDAYAQHRAHVVASTQPSPRYLLALVAQRRLQPFSDSASLGADVLAELMRDVTPEEVATACNEDAPDWAGRTVGGATAFGESQRKALVIALYGSLQNHIELGSIRSAEDVGGIAHRLVAGFNGHSFADPRLARLYSAVATAFSARRSLLLISTAGAFQHQVRMEELPWIAPLLSELQSTTDGNGPHFRTRRMSLARELLAAYWTHYPEVLMPNKLVSALRQLFNTNGDRVCGRSDGATFPPVVEELAADIFGNAFSPKFLEAAKRAAVCIANTTYSRYYKLDAVIAKLAVHATLEDAVSALLPSLTQGSTIRAYSVTGNRRTIEASQLLTTHNLILWDILAEGKDGSAVMPSARSMVLSVWAKLPQMVAEGTDLFSISAHSRALSNAWRHLVYFLSRMPLEEQRTLLHELRATCGQHFAMLSPPANAIAKAVDALLVCAHNERIEVDDDTIIGWMR